jgi:hypothetical protein
MSSDKKIFSGGEIQEERLKNLGCTLSGEALPLAADWALNA